MIGRKGLGKDAGSTLLHLIFLTSTDIRKRNTSGVHSA